MEKVKIISNTDSPVTVKLDDIKFRRTWPTKGYTVNVEKDILENLMYDIGFKYMIDNTILYIEDMEVKKELGLEPEDAKEPVNIIRLTNKDMERYMRFIPLAEFTAKVAKLSYEQSVALAEYAIENKCADYEKAKILKKKCGKDIVRAIQLDEAAEEIDTKTK